MGMMGMGTKPLEDRFKKIQDHCDKNDVELAIQYDPIERTWDIWVDNDTSEPDSSADTMGEVVEFLESEFELD